MPRDSTSPNFKAFQSKTKLDSSPVNHLDGLGVSNNNSFGFDCVNKTEHSSFVSVGPFARAEKPNYFVLSKNKASVLSRPRPSDCMENYLKCFSQKLSIEPVERVAQADPEKKLSPRYNVLNISRFRKNN